MGRLRVLRPTDTLPDRWIANGSRGAGLVIMNGVGSNSIGLLLAAACLLVACGSPSPTGLPAPPTPSEPRVLPSPVAALLSTPVPRGRPPITRATANRLESIAEWTVPSGDQYGQAIVSLAFSSDGRALAVLTRGGSLSLWDVASASSRYVLIAGSRATTAAFDASSSRIAVSGDRGVLLWDLSEPGSPKIIDSPGYGSFETQAVLFTKDSTALAYDDSYKGEGMPCWAVEVLDLGLRRVRHFFEAGCTWPVRLLAISRDGQYLAWAEGDGALRMVDIDAGNTVYSGSGWKRSRDGKLASPSAVTGLAFSPDGVYFAWASNVFHDEEPPQLHLWNMQRKTQQDIVLAAEGHSPAFSPDGSLLVLASGDMLLLFDPMTGSELGTRSQMVGIHTIAFSPEGDLLVVGNEDGSVQFLSAEE